MTRYNVCDKPLAAAGLTSYRYKGNFGWIMIGARDDEDALREAKRSVGSHHSCILANLQVWNGTVYVPCSANKDDGRDALTKTKCLAEDWHLQRWNGPEQLNTNMVFCDAPGDLGSAWYNLGQIENELASILLELPIGSAAVVGDHAWFLAKVVDADDARETLELRHGTLIGNVVEDSISRFEHDLEWVDADEEAITEYTMQVQMALDLPTIKCIDAEFMVVRDGQESAAEKCVPV